MGWSGFYCKISLRLARFEIMKKKNGASKVVLGGVIRQGSGLGVEKTLAYLGLWLIATSFDELRSTSHFEQSKSSQVATPQISYSGFCFCPLDLVPLFYLIGGCSARSISVLVVLYSDLSAGFWFFDRFFIFKSAVVVFLLDSGVFPLGLCFFPLGILLFVGFWVWTVLPRCSFRWCFGPIS